MLIWHCIVEPESIQLPPPPTTTTTTILNRLTSNKVKQKERKNTSSVALSDILSHEHLFMTNIPTITITTVRSFINQIITKIILPPTQHYKIMRYLIIESIHAKYYNLYHNVQLN